MNSLYRSLRNENGGMRGLTGSGEPGLHTLLGGTGEELDSGSLTITGGPGQSSGVAKLARAHRDTRLAAVASGTSGGARLPGGGAGSGGRYRDPPRHER